MEGSTFQQKSRARTSQELATERSAGPQRRPEGGHQRHHPRGRRRFNPRQTPPVRSRRVQVARVRDHMQRRRCVLQVSILNILPS